jgi:hypothetical protein
LQREVRLETADVPRHPSLQPCGIYFQSGPDGGGTGIELRTRHDCGLDNMEIRCY